MLSVCHAIELFGITLRRMRDTLYVKIQQSPLFVTKETAEENAFVYFVIAFSCLVQA